MAKEVQRIDTGERRRLVLELRRHGATYEQIAAAVKDEYGEERLPNGWDERYAWKDLQRELDRVRSDVREESKRVLELELARLDEMLTRIYPVALGTEKVPPDPRAIDRVIKIMKRRAELRGLDAPERKEHEHTGELDVQSSTLDEVLAEIADRAKRLGEEE